MFFFSPTFNIYHVNWILEIFWHTFFDIFEWNGLICARVCTVCNAFSLSRTNVALMSIYVSICVLENARALTLKPSKASRQMKCIHTHYIKGDKQKKITGKQAQMSCWIYHVFEVCWARARKVFGDHFYRIEKSNKINS